MTREVKNNARRTPEFKLIKGSQLKRNTVSKWKDRGIVVLAGSYVSTFLDTGLPSGTSVCDGLWRMIFGRAWPDWLRRDFTKVPFEALMQCYPGREDVRSIVRNMFSVRLPNPVHSCIAASLKEGRIKGIITTNYDLAFESCLDDCPGIMTIDDCVSYGEYKKVHVKPGICFKIHGTATEEKEGTDLEGEALLPKWKTKLLGDMVKDRVIVLVGYSGRDFDVCPELAETTCQTELVWLQPKRWGISANAKRVLSRTDGILVVGELLPFLEKVLDAKIGVCLKNDHAWEPEKYFHPGVCNRWRVNILNWMGCGRLGLEGLANLDCEQGERLKIQADMYGHIGRYKDAVKALEKMLKSRVNRGSERTRLEIEIALRNFLYGRQWRAWRSILRLERRTGGHLSPEAATGIQLAEAKMVMYMRGVAVARMMRCRWLVKRIQVRAQRDYDLFLPLLESERAFDRLQTFQLNAERIGVGRPNRHLLPSRDGYRNLGLASMDVIAKRDGIRATSGKLDKLDALIARSCLAKAERYGWEHEAWKFNWILLRRSRRHRIRYLRGWLKHFCGTQYPLLFRLLQLTMNSIASDDKGWLGPSPQMGESKKRAKSDEGEAQSRSGTA